MKTSIILISILFSGCVYTQAITDQDSQIRTTIIGQWTSRTEYSDGIWTIEESGKGRILRCPTDECVTIRFKWNINNGMLKIKSNRWEKSFRVTKYNSKLFWLYNKKNRSYEFLRDYSYL